MNKTTIASTLAAFSLAFGTVAAYAQGGVATNPSATPDVRSMPSKDSKAKDTTSGGTGSATINRSAATDVTSMPPKGSKAKDTSMGGYVGNSAPNSPNAAPDVTGKPKDTNMSKSTKSTKRNLPACTSTTPSGTDCTQP